jgi:branched-chain amino acid transport system ATP-binding protein
VFPTLTVEENLKVGAYPLGGLPEDRLEAVVGRFPLLGERLEERAGNLSGGQQQMLAMARALVPNPRLLLLDEPSAGLAPDIVDDMFDHVDTVNDAGVTVVVVEQNAKTALRRCDRGYVLAQGENRYVDDGDALLEDPEVRRQFLGG